MVDHLKNLLEGAARALDIAPARRLYRVDPQGQVTDAARLRGDFLAVGSDLKKQLKREQTDYRAR